MTWVKIDDGMPENLKIVGLSDHAFRVYIQALCYSARNLTDGFVPENVSFLHTNMHTNARKTRTKSAPNAAQELAETGLWHATKQGSLTGYEINDYLEYNPSKAHSQAIKDQRAAAGAIGGKRSKPPSKPEANRFASASPSASNMSEAKRNPQPQPQPHIEEGQYQYRDADTNNGHPPDHQKDPFTITTPSWSKHDGELGHAIDELIQACTDRDLQTPRVIDSLATKHGLTPADIHDARQALKAIHADSPTKYAVGVLKSRRT